MPQFNESFYTDDFDQEMLDFIKDNYDITPKTGEYSARDFYLKYSKYSLIDYFWTTNVMGVCSTQLTKQEFKEKIGMTNENTSQQNKRVSPCGYEPADDCVKYKLVDREGFFEANRGNREIFEEMSVDGIHLEGAISDNDLVSNMGKFEYLIIGDDDEFKYFEKVEENFSAVYDLSQIQKDCAELDIDVAFSKEGVTISDPLSEMYKVDSAEDYDNIVNAIRLLNSKVI